jgi:hypothetical protein
MKEPFRFLLAKSLRINKLISDILIRRDGNFLNSSRKQKKLVAELRNNVLSQKYFDKKLSHAAWTRNVRKLAEFILSDNPIKFLQNEIIRETMFIGNALFVLPELLYLRKNKWRVWKDIIREDYLIPTEKFIFYPKSSGNSIHHAYHLARFQENTEINFNELSYIFEFGGGYGNMCRLIRKLGFNGKYVIFDLPIFSALQTFYLNISNISASFNGVGQKTKTYCVSDFLKLKKILRDIDKRNGKNLFIATWSLSESPMVTRKNIKPLLKKFDYQLIAYQARFKGLDNIKYFKRYMKKMKRCSWEIQAIKQLPNNYYLFGKHKS